MAATPQGGEHFDQACDLACSLLDSVGTTLEHRHRPLNASILEQADSLVFSWTLRVGAVLGFSQGQGFLIRRLESGKWSTPCFVSMNVASAGAQLGVEKISTVLVSRTPRLVAALEMPPFIPVFGVDVSVQAQDSFEVDKSSPGWGRSDRGVFGVTERDAFATPDCTSISTSTGMLISFSLKGGATTLDSKRNAECYGEGVGIREILSRPAPCQFQPLSDRLEAIMKLEPQGTKKNE